MTARADLERLAAELRKRVPHDWFERLSPKMRERLLAEVPGLTPPKAEATIRP